MRYWKEGLVSLAASSGFFVLQEALFPLASPYNWLCGVLVFVAAAGLVHILSRRPNDSPKRGSLSGNVAGGDLTADIDNSTVAPGGGTLSNNQAGRDMTIRIKDSELS